MKKRPIYRYLFYTMWLAVVAGVVVLLVAANGNTKARTCKGIEITIDKGEEALFLKEGHLLKTINQSHNGSIVNRPFAAINLDGLEQNLRKDPWIRKAELYFDTKDILHVSVEERQPIARAFITSSHSVYLDSSGAVMPLLPGLVARLPVITGYRIIKKMTAADSIYQRHFLHLVNFIYQHPFWNAQVGQVDILPGGKIELVPAIGSHIIQLGYPQDAEQKLNKLFVFYKQVLPHAGLTKYSALNLEFDGQVVAVKRGTSSPVDSIQLQQNIQQLVRKKQEEQEATASIVTTTVSNTSAPEANHKPIQETNPSKTESNNSAKKTNPNPIPAEKQKTTIQPERKPKAVMPAKPVNDY